MRVLKLLTIAGVVAAVRFNLSTRHEGTETSRRALMASSSGFNLSTRHEGTETSMTKRISRGQLASTYRPDMRVLKPDAGGICALPEICFNLSTRHEGTETHLGQAHHRSQPCFNLSTRHEGTETSPVCSSAMKRLTSFNLSTRHEGTETMCRTISSGVTPSFNLSTRHEGTETPSP